MRIAVMLCASGVIAAIQVGVQGLDWVPSPDEIKKFTEDEKARIRLREERGVSLAQLREMIDQGAVVIDTRPRDAFEESHPLFEIYPPLLNVPSDEIDDHIERLMQLQGSAFVLYCTSVTCDYAEDVYLVLEGLGLGEMWIYFDGWEGLQEAGWPVTSGPDEWTGYDEFDDPNADPNAMMNDTSQDPNATEEPPAGGP